MFLLYFKRISMFFIFITTITNNFSIAQEEDNYFLLLSYIREGNVEGVIDLLKEGVDPNGNEESKGAPLIMATGNYEFDVMKALLQAGADPNPYKFGNYRCTLIVALLEYEELDDSLLEATRILLEAGTDPNAHSGHLFNITALMLAAEKAGSDDPHWNGQQALELTKLLLDHGADPNETEENGYTALIGAEFKEGAELLLKFGADPNKQSNDGRTALMHASRIGNLELINTLLEWGADPSITNNEDNTAVTLAKNQEVAEYIENWGR